MNRADKVGALLNFLHQIEYLTPHLVIQRTESETLAATGECIFYFVA